MTEQILSPDVYISENDQSFIPPGQQATGLAIIGPTQKGTAFIPTDVFSYQDFITKFGSDTTSTYVPQTVYTYLQAGSSIKIVRVLGNGGWQYNSTNKLAAIAASGSSTILAVLYPSQNLFPALVNLNGSSISGSLGNFKLIISGSEITTSTVSGSLNTSAANYLTKLIGSDQFYQTASAFPYLNFNNYYTGSVNPTASAALVLTTTNCTFTSSFAEGYDHAVTPWVLSDGGQQLFRIHHLSDGFATNTDVKIAIQNITKNSNSSVWSTFDIIVRAANDTDKNQTVYEQYTTVNLNVSDPNYIARAIGDKYSLYNNTLGHVVDYGFYSNISSYIRVEMAPGVEAGSILPNLIPAGHCALYETIAGFGSLRLPAAATVASSTSSYVLSGFDYNNTDNWNYLNPVPQEAVTGSNGTFTMPSNDNKFVLPFQGGTDGMDYTVIKNTGANISADGTNVFGFNLSTSNTGGSAAFFKAVNILSNPEAYSFDILVVPGVIEQYHAAVTSYVQTMCETRGDVIYLRDLTGVNETVATAVSVAAGLDSSYSATYYPWLLVTDIGSNKRIFVPPTVCVPQSYAYTDSVAFAWYAPAGLNRGVLGSVMDLRYRLYKADRDTLYQGKINPIAKFTNTGVVIFGQKTLQVADTALNRINVRRLLINLKDFVNNISLPYVFEQNNNSSRVSLYNKINPYMANVQQNNGLFAYRIVIDDSNNTQDTIDRQELIVNIYVSPTATIEFILCTFSVSPSGVSFS